MIKQIEQEYSFKVRKDFTCSVNIPPPPKMNEYIEFLFNLVLELIALIDFAGDLILVRALF